MRSAPARASWPTVRIAASCRIGGVISSMYVENARNVPRLMRPLIASQPPTASTATWPSAGIVCIAGCSRAWMFTRRTRDANIDRDRSCRRSSSRCSWPNPFTTRTPVTSSSTTLATSPAFCWASQLAGNTDVRSRIAVISSSGATASITSESSGERMSIAANDTMNSRMLATPIGRNCRNPCNKATSDDARLTSCPVCSSSWLAKSRRWS
jgi:hypothetical protein